MIAPAESEGYTDKIEQEKVMKKIVLASGSPRRKEILAKMGVSFYVVVSQGEENADFADPVKTVEKLSRDKVLTVAEQLKEEKIPKKKTLQKKPKRTPSKVMKLSLLMKPLKKPRRLPANSRKISNRQKKNRTRKRLPFILINLL